MAILTPIYGKMAILPWFMKETLISWYNYMIFLLIPKKDWPNQVQQISVIQNRYVVTF
jgi:hypothetical protein